MTSRPDSPHRLWTIFTELYGPLDKYGHRSFDLNWIGPDEIAHCQSFFADEAATVARLRHNLAVDFWWNRRRLRLAAEAANSNEL